MTRHWILLSIVFGVFLMCGGFVYDVLFAGIPHQDPTPEMAARYERHSQIASVLQFLGLVAVTLAVLAAVVRRSRGRQTGNRASRESRDDGC